MMLKVLFSNRLFIGALAFFLLCVGGGLLYMQHVKHQAVRELARTGERLKQWNENQNSQPTAEVSSVGEVPVGQPLQGGHFHNDGTWHPGPHETEGQPVAEVSLPQTQPSTRQPSVIVQENPNADTIADVQSIDGKKMARYQQRVRQYLKDHKEWRAKQDEAFTEWMQAGEICLNIFPVPPEQYDEYIGGLSEAERQEIVAKLEVGLEKYQDASKKLTTFRKEKPIFSTAPQNN